MAIGELPKIWGFPFNIYKMAEARYFKFGTQLGFAKAHHKTTPSGPVLSALPKIAGFPLIFVQFLKLATSNLACSWDCPMPTTKPTPREKVGLALG